MAIGRIAVASPGAAPHVVPINYAVDEDSIVFRMDPGTKLDLLREFPISFQVDLIDPFHKTGWSLLVQGVATEILSGHVDPGPWPSGDKQHWVRLCTAAITGRRLVLAEVELDSRGYL